LDVKVISTNETRRPNCTAAGGTLQRLLDQEGEQHLTMLKRTIVESEGNGGALIDPVLCAISAVMLAYPAWLETGLRWIEAFDDNASPQDSAPAEACRTGTVDHRRHAGTAAASDILPPNGARIAIKQGLFLLQHKGPQANSPISQIGAEQGLAPGECCQVINAARLYGDRQDLVARLSREALFRLSAPIMPGDVRQAIERRLAAGERLREPEMERMRTGGPTAVWGPSNGSLTPGLETSRAADSADPCPL
jgi:hypothetical protein